MEICEEDFTTDFTHCSALPPPSLNTRSITSLKDGWGTLVALSDDGFVLFGETPRDATVKDADLLDLSERSTLLDKPLADDLPPRIPGHRH